MQEINSEKLDLRPLARYILDNIRRGWNDEMEAEFQAWMKAREGKK